VSSWIPDELRELVRQRAHRACEYCLIHESDTYLSCEVDHIISEKHGGETEARNLAYACFYGNRHKGPNVATIDPATGEAIRLFNPRHDVWSDHFALKDCEIVARSPIADATSRILGFNMQERIRERQILKAQGKYPSGSRRTEVA